MRINNVPLIILGSGSSIPFGLPSMWQLAEHLRSKVSLTDDKDKSQFEEFKDNLGRLGDLELALNEMHLRENVLAQIIVQTWELVNKKDLIAYDNLLTKSEFPLSVLIAHLLKTANRKLSIITTNYDRIAEYAANLSQAFVCTAFCQGFFGHFSDQMKKNDLSGLRGYKGQVNIWKVHGSLDWFKSKDDLNIQLPLRHTIPGNCVPAIVTPGLTKYFQTHIEPYRTILAHADSEIDDANGYLCIGYGFNDLHVQPKLINQIKAQKPILVLTKELTSKTIQAIIGNNCKSYLLIEEYNAKDTRVYSNEFPGELILPDRKIWELKEFLKLII
jgi:hypothetical protein